MKAWGPLPPATPRLPASLRRLGAEVDERWPTRDRSSDGWIGDAAHQARNSDHNPDSRGIVHAVDITALGIDPWVVVVGAAVHPSTAYVIFRALLFARSHGFRGIPYEGPDPHMSHVHVSITHSRPAEHSRHLWVAG